MVLFTSNPILAYAVLSTSGLEVRRELLAQIKACTRKDVDI